MLMPMAWMTEEDHIMFVIPVCPMSLQTSGKQMIIRKGRPLFFKTQKASDYQKIIRLYANKYRPKTPWSCPIRMVVDYILPRPTRLNTKKTLPCEHYADKRPDLDNLQKGTQDAFHGFWEDDAQICELSIRKFHCAFGGDARIIVELQKLKPIGT